MLFVAQWLRPDPGTESRRQVLARATSDAILLGEVAHRLGLHLRVEGVSVVAGVLACRREPSIGPRSRSAAERR